MSRHQTTAYIIKTSDTSKVLLHLKRCLTTLMFYDQNVSNSHFIHSFNVDVIIDSSRFACSRHGQRSPTLLNSVENPAGTAINSDTKISKYFLRNLLYLHCLVGRRKGIRPVKTEWWGACVVIGLG